MFSWLFALSLEQVQEEIWAAKDNIRGHCDLAWEFLHSTSAIEETVFVLRAQVQAELESFAAHEKVQALTSDDRAFALGELHKYANGLKFLVTSVCDVLPDIIDEFEGISSRLLDDDASAKEEDVLMQMRDHADSQLEVFERNAINAGIDAQYWRPKKQMFAKILFHHIQRLLDEAIVEAIRGYKEAALDAIDDVLAITIPGAHDLKSAKQLVNEVAVIQYQGQRLLEKLPFSNRTAITMAQEEIRAASDTFIRQVQMFHAMKDPAALEHLVPEVEIPSDSDDSEEEDEEQHEGDEDAKEQVGVKEPLKLEAPAQVSQETEVDEEEEEGETQEQPEEPSHEKEEEEPAEAKTSGRRKSARASKPAARTRRASTAAAATSTEDAREAARREVREAAERRASAVQGTPSTRKRKAASDDKAAAAPVSTRKTRRGT